MGIPPSYIYTYGSQCALLHVRFWLVYDYSFEIDYMCQLMSKGMEADDIEDMLIAEKKKNK